MVAANSTLLATNAGTTQNLTLTNVNPAGVGHVIVFAGRMSAGGEDATPTISDSVDGATGWASITLARIPGYAYNYAGRAWIKAAWSGTRDITIGGDVSITGVNAFAVHTTAVDATTPIGGFWTTSADIGDAAVTGTLDAAPRSEDITFAVVVQDAEIVNPTVVWGAGFAEPNSTWRRTGTGTTAGAASFCVAIRGTGSTSTSIPITDASDFTGGSRWSSLGYAFVLRNATATGSTGTIAQTLSPFTSTGSGTVFLNATGTIARVLGAFTSNINATVPVPNTPLVPVSRQVLVPPGFYDQDTIDLSSFTVGNFVVAYLATRSSTEGFVTPAGWYLVHTIGAAVGTNSPAYRAYITIVPPGGLGSVRFWVNTDGTSAGGMDATKVLVVEQYAVYLRTDIALSALVATEATVGDTTDVTTRTVDVTAPGPSRLAWFAGLGIRLDVTSPLGPGTNWNQWAQPGPAINMLWGLGGSTRVTDGSAPDAVFTWAGAQRARGGEFAVNLDLAQSTGSGASTLSAFASAASGNVRTSGTVAATLGAFTPTATGTVSAVAVTGTSARTLAPFVSNATGSGGSTPTPPGVGATLNTAATGPQAVPYYSIAGAITVNPGTDLTALAASSAIGATFYLTAGKHRVLNIRPRNSQTFIGQQGAILSGSRLLSSSGWTVQSAGIWRRVDSSQTDPGVEDPWGYESEKDDAAQPIINANYWASMQYRDNLFYDGRMLRRRPTLALMVPNSDECFIDYATDTVYLSRDPSIGVVEQAIPGATAFLSDGSVGGNYIKICNLILEHYGPSYQTGAIHSVDSGGGFMNVLNPTNGLDGSGNLMGWDVVECEIRYNHGAGLMLGPGSRAIRLNVHRNGCAGIKATGRRILYDSCWVHHNNIARCARWNEAGGGKFWNTQGFVITNSIFEDNYGPGMWLDYIYGISGNPVIGTTPTDQTYGAVRVQAASFTPSYDANPFVTGVGWRIFNNTSRRNDGPDWSIEMTWGGELNHNLCYDSAFGDNPLSGAANWAYGQEVDPNFRTGSVFCFMPGPTWIHHNIIGAGSATRGGVVMQYQWRGTVDPLGPQSVGAINTPSPWGTCQRSVVEDNIFDYGPPGYTGYQWAASAQNDIANGGDHPSGVPFPNDVVENPIAERNGIIFRRNSYATRMPRAFDRGSQWASVGNELDYQYDNNLGSHASTFYTNGQPGVAQPFWDFFNRRFTGLDDAQLIMGWDTTSPPIAPTGVIAATLARFTPTATGTVAAGPGTVTGTIARTLNPFTSTSTGSQAITGSSARTLANFVSTASGTSGLGFQNPLIPVSRVVTVPVGFYDETPVNLSAMTVGNFVVAYLGTRSSDERFNVPSGWYLVHAGGAATGTNSPAYRAMITIVPPGGLGTVLFWLNDNELDEPGQHDGTKVLIVEEYDINVRTDIPLANVVVQEVFVGALPGGTEDLTARTIDVSPPGVSGRLAWFSGMAIRLDPGPYDGPGNFWNEWGQEGPAVNLLYLLGGSTYVIDGSAPDAAFIWTNANRARGGQFAIQLDYAFGTAAQTLATFAIAATAVEVMTGTITQTLSAFTSTATGTGSPRIGTIAATLAPFTSVVTGIESISGASARTLAPFTSAAAGVTGAIGTVARTLAPFTSSAAGIETITGSRSGPLAPFVSTATGTSLIPGVAGSIDRTLAPFTSSATGTLLLSITGAGAVTLAAFTSTGTSTTGNTGTIARTLAPFTGAASGASLTPITGTVARTLGAFVPAIYGTALSGGDHLELSAHNGYVFREVLVVQVHNGTNYLLAQEMYEHNGTAFVRIW